jgi:hypothetical protein
MQIETVELAHSDIARAHGVRVTALKVTGAVDADNAIVRMAREMVRTKCSEKALSYFDEAVASDLLRSDR